MNRKKRIRLDGRAESVMYPFVFIIALVMILGFILSGLSRFAASGEMVNNEYLSYSMPFGLYNYTTIDVYDDGDPRYVTYSEGGSTIEGFQVSDADILDDVPYPTDEDPFIFTDDDGDLKYVHVIRGNVDYDPESTDIWERYQDFLAIRRHISGGVFTPHWQNAAIPFTTIEANYDTHINASITNFQLGSSEDSVFINSSNPAEEDFVDDLYDNDFRLFYGWSLFRIEDVDFWNAISMVMYAEIPGVHPMIEFIIHAFVLGTIIFVVFTMATRIIPFIGD